MWVLQKIFYLLLLLFGAVLSKSNILQEKIIVEYIDNRFMDLQAGVYKLTDKINALNLSTRFKIDLSKHVKYSAVAFKLINNNHKLKLFQAEDTITGFNTLDILGIEDLCLKNTKPPVVWPFKQGIWYNSLGWSPDGSKFPTPLPDGRWLTYGRLFFRNKTKILDLCLHYLTFTD